MSEKYLMKGNEAVAEAAIRCGCKLFFGYPITPQTEISAYMSKKLPKIGGTFLQAESELAAANMVLGAVAAGERAMTSSSSPGISLKAEAISYMVGSDVPALIVNMQRGGPGLGGIQPSQQDYFQATRGPGHGDMRCLVLAPSTIQELVTLVYDGFDLADIYRLPCILLGDGLLGQMMEPVDFDVRTTRELPEKTWAACGHENKRPQNVVNSLLLDAKSLEDTILARAERYKIIEEKEVRVETDGLEDADLVVTAFGATSRIVQSAVKKARQQGYKIGVIRPITLYPFPYKTYEEAAKIAKAFLCVELNMGQMLQDVKLGVNGAKPVHFAGRTGGVLITPHEVYDAIEKIMGGLA
jgi:2-oxoglutarate ferredoxin oxidoreductase subunit alpha